MKACCQHRIDKQRLRFWLFPAMLAGLAGWYLWPKGETARTLSAPNAQVSFANEEPRIEQAAAELSASEQESVSPKLTDAANEVISEHLLEANRLLDAIDASNAKREMDLVKDGRRIIAVRVEAPTVEQFTPIYDLLSDASKQLSGNPEVQKEFCDQVAQFLAEIGGSYFKVVIQSTDVVTGTADYVVFKAKAKSTTVKYENGSVHVRGFFQSTTSHFAGARYDHLFTEP